MKIAVLTMTFTNNYGGIVQAYALMESLKKLGHEPELLFVQFENRDFNSIIKKSLKKYFLSYISKKWRYPRIQKIVEKNTNYFMEQYIVPKTEPIYTEKDFERVVNDKYDAYVVGSDQVWRPEMYKFINHAFFDFVKNPNAILLSYAASFGVDTWNYTQEDTLRYKEQIKRFNGVSVREDSGVQLCKENFGINADHVLDPTMLLTVDEYRKIIRAEKEPNHSGKLLTYVLDKNDEKESLINVVSGELSLKPFEVNVKSTDVYAALNHRVYPTVTSWLKGFDEAQFVVTDSFHGCVFAIIFNKPFIVYGNIKRGMARFNSLLKMFNLEDRLVYKYDDITVKKINQKIDWINVNKKLEEYTTGSIKFLESHLDKNDE